MAKKNLNNITIQGNLAVDPEMRYTPNGKAVTKLGIIVNNGWGDKDSSFWLNVEVWGKQAESANQYLTKGQSVTIEGELAIDTWDDDKGQKHYKTKVTARAVHFGAKPKGYVAPKDSNPVDNAVDEDDSIPF